MARTVDRDGALHILGGVTVRAFDSYRAAGGFPTPNERGRYQVTELEAWKAAQPKPARGSAKGQTKPKDPAGYPCGRCRTGVPRRFRWKTPGGGDELLCKPCLLAAGRERAAAGVVEAAV